jgi:hypothetical protein
MTRTRKHRFPLSERINQYGYHSRLPRPRMSWLMSWWRRFWLNREARAILDESRSHSDITISR